MSPESVYESLRKLITFDKLIGREIFPGYFEYQIIFKCNEEAVHARRELLRTISKFGRNAIVVWDTTNDVVDGATPKALDQDGETARNESNPTLIPAGACTQGSALAPLTTSRQVSIDLNRDEESVEVIDPIKG